jgi:hypothetical protein
MVVGWVGESMRGAGVSSSAMPHIAHHARKAPFSKQKQHENANDKPMPNAETAHF